MARRDEKGRVRKEKAPKDRRKKERRYRHGGRRGRRRASAETNRSTER